VIIMDSLKFDIYGIRNILLQLYDSKPPFPISKKKTLAAALGGKSNKIKIHDGSDEIPVIKLVDKAFLKQKEFNEPNEIIDALIGGSFTNVIVKSNILQLVNNLNYPIDDETQLEKNLAGIKIYGMIPEEITETMKYPVRDPSAIVKKFGVAYRKVFDSDIGLLDGLAELESFMPMPTKKKPKAVKKLEFYRCYIIEESKAKYCFEVFEEAISRGSKGICITRTHPKQLISNFESLAGKTELVWLTDRESVGEQKTVSPMISSVNYLIEEFIDHNPGAVILFDGLEYLITVNSFKPVLFFIQGIKDKIAENEASLLFSASPLTFDKQELTILEREIEIIREGERLEVDIKPSGKVFTKIEETKKLLDEAIDKIHKKKVDEIPESSEKAKIEAIESELGTPDSIDDIGSSGIVDTDLELDLAKKMTRLEKSEPVTEEGAVESEPESETVSESELETEPEPEGEPEEAAPDFLGNIVIPEGEEPCRSCEGTGKCIWCDVTGNCETCKGKGTDVGGNPCADCKGSGKCRSCEGSGKCRWCKGRGY